MVPLVKLAYRQIIDSSAQPGFESNVFNDTYSELLLQAKIYNREGRFTTFAEMIAANPKANSLHYKVGFAIGLYVDELNKKIPGLTDALGQSVPFDIFKTEIVQSDITNKANHAVAITYITSSYTLMASFGEYLVLANPENEKEEKSDKSTFTIAFQPNLSIVHWTN